MSILQLLGHIGNQRFITVYPKCFDSSGGVELEAPGSVVVYIPQYALLAVELLRFQRYEDIGIGGGTRADGSAEIVVGEYHKRAGQFSIDHHLAYGSMRLRMSCVGRIFARGAVGEYYVKFALGQAPHTLSYLGEIVGERRKDGAIVEVGNMLPHAQFASSRVEARFAIGVTRPAQRKHMPFPAIVSKNRAAHPDRLIIRVRHHNQALHATT